MQHPERSRVILTRIEDDGTSDYSERIVDAVIDHDAAGNAVYQATQLWGTADGIGVVGPGVNPDQVSEPWFPEPGGIRFRFFTFLPVSAGNGEPAAPQLQDVEGESSNFAEAFDPERPGMHISDTIDFVHVLAGEVILELERGEVLVKEGDSVIMRGGWHNWRNEADEPCTVSSVMVGTHRRNG
jgi:mannose-6-phosphate isomerase-like protein (cupin superfamily)